MNRLGQLTGFSGLSRGRSNSTGDGGGDTPPPSDPWVTAVPDDAFRAALESVGITNLSELGAATVIDIDNVPLFSSTWTGIEYATSLQEMRFHYTGLSGDLSDIAGLTNISFLGLTGTNITGHVTELAAFPNLDILGINNTAIQGTLAQLAASVPASMRFLYMDATSISGDVSAISSLTSLRVIDLDGAPVTGNLSSFSGMTSMRELDISNTSITGDLASLTSMSNLREFYATSAGALTVTSPALQIDSLQQLILPNNGLSQVVVDAVLSECVDSLGLVGRASCILDLTGNTAPSAQGVSDANTLISAGWTVTHA